MRASTSPITPFSLCRRWGARPRLPLHPRVLLLGCHVGGYFRGHADFRECGRFPLFQVVINDHGPFSFRSLDRYLDRNQPGRANAINALPCPAALIAGTMPSSHPPQPTGTTTYSLSMGVAGRVDPAGLLGALRPLQRLRRSGRGPRRCLPASCTSSSPGHPV